MKKGNVIDLATHLDQPDSSESSGNTSISEELAKAIQALIHRMRKLGPIQS